MKGPLRLRLEGIGWLAAWRVARVLPERMVMRGFERLSARSYRRNVAKRGIVAANLEPIVGAGAADEAAREAFRWYGRYWAETFRMQDLTDAEVDARVRCDGWERIAAAYEAGKGALLVTAHLGNWDAGGRWAAKRWPLTAVVEVLRPRMLFDRFLVHRRKMGLGIIPLERGQDVTGACLERLAKGEIVALVADRDLSGHGVEVTMFGRRVKLPPGPAVLSLRTGAPVLPACAYQHDDGTWQARVFDPITAADPHSDDAVRELTQKLATAFEGMIAAAPSQWHVFGPYWGDR